MAKRKTKPKENTSVAPRSSPALTINKVATEIRDLIEAARNHVSVTANLAMVSLYWNIGRIIARDIRRNEKRAEYGVALLKELAGILTKEYGKGYSRANLQDMRRSFNHFEIAQTLSGESPPPAIIPPLAGESKPQRICQPVAGKSIKSGIYRTPADTLSETEILQPRVAESTDSEICQPLAGKSLSGQLPPSTSVAPSHRIVIDFRKHFRLGWTHYQMLLSISDPVQRRFYFEQASSQHWSKREFRRQIDRGLFERVAFSKDTARLVVQEKQTGPAEVVRYEDILKDPYVLDFLGLQGAYSEKDLETAIVRNLEQFLIELGTDFCFIGRQRAMRIDEDDYFLDLLFYHRSLRCLVAIDLKIGTFTAADKGQMDLYLAWLKEHDWRPGENEPVGLILCTSARRQHVELLLRHGPHKMKVAEYLTRLPDKRLLEERLKMYSRLLKDRDRESAE